MGHYPIDRGALERRRRVGRDRVCSIGGSACRQSASRSGPVGRRPSFGGILGHWRAHRHGQGVALRHPTVKGPRRRAQRCIARLQGRQGRTTPRTFFTKHTKCDMVAGHVTCRVLASQSASRPGNLSRNGGRNEGGRLEWSRRDMILLPAGSSQPYCKGSCPTPLWRDVRRCLLVAFSKPVTFLMIYASALKSFIEPHPWMGSDRRVRIA